MITNCSQCFSAASIKLYVEWAVDLRDDSDIGFYIDSFELLGRRLRLEIANLYDIVPSRLIINQIRAKKKKDDTLVIMTVACNFADQLGNIMMDNEVKERRVCRIRDQDIVPMPGEWRALVQVLSPQRLKARRQERKRLKMLLEHAKQRIMI